MIHLARLMTELNKQISFCLNLTMNVSLFSRHRPNMKDNNSGEWLDIKVFLLCIRQLQAVSSIENFYNISMKHYIRCAKVCMEANVNKVVSNKYSKFMGGSNNIYNYIDWLPFWTLCRNSKAFRTFPIKSILISFWCICINLWFKGRYTLRLGFKIQITDALYDRFFQLLEKKMNGGRIKSI